VLNIVKTKDTTPKRSLKRKLKHPAWDESVENTFFRFKNSFGSKFLSRNEDNMKNEMTIKCQLLNKMFEIGKPKSMRIA